MKIGKVKVTITLSSGATVVIKCKEFDITKLTGTKGNREMNVVEADQVFTVDINEIVAVTTKRCLF